MATKKKRKKAKRRNPGHKKATTHRKKRRRSNPSHAHHKKTTHRRRRRANPSHAKRRTSRRRRHKNPGLLGVVLAPVAGVLVEGTIKGVAAFATNNAWVPRIMSGVASVGGAALSVNHPRLGTAIATGGLAASVVDPGLTAVAKAMTPKSTAGAHGVGAIEASSGWPGRTRGELSPGSVPMMNAVDIDIGDFEDDYEIEGIGAIVVR